jgi:hypothetical protein
MKYAAEIQLPGNVIWLLSIICFANIMLSIFASSQQLKLTEACS